MDDAAIPNKQCFEQMPVVLEQRDFAMVYSMVLTSYREMNSRWSSQLHYSVSSWFTTGVHCLLSK